MNKSFAIPAVFLVMIMLSGCSATAGVFKVGAVVGVIAVVIVTVIILWVISLFRNRT
jgi:hypothetical protein